MGLKINIIKGFLFFLLVYFLVSSAVVSTAATSTQNGNCSVIYGFYPDYPYLGSYQPDWNVVNYVSFYKWILNSDGTIQKANISYYNIVKSQAHAHGAKIALCIKGYDSGNPVPMDNVLAYHQQDCIQNITNLLNSTGADGINIDWEWNSPAPTTNPADGKPIEPEFENFMKNLYNRMKAVNPNQHLSFDTYSDLSDEGLYVNSNLSSYCDAVILMNYDLNTHYTGPNSPGPNSTYFDVADSITEAKKYFPSNEIILGLPFYGYDMICSGSSPGVKVSSLTTVYIGDAIAGAQTYGRMWDSNSQTPWYKYQVGNQWHQVWYDDDQSLGIKNAYAQSQGIAGISFWALGYEATYPQIWQQIFNGTSPPIVIQPPVAAFSASTTSGRTPLTVTFTDKSKGNITSWTWSFGDGTTSTVQSPKHTYSFLGTYTAKLTVNGAGGTSTAQKAITVSRRR